MGGMLTTARASSEVVSDIMLSCMCKRKTCGHVKYAAWTFLNRQSQVTQVHFEAGIGHTHSGWRIKQMAGLTSFFILSSASQNILRLADASFSDKFDMKVHFVYLGLRKSTFPTKQFQNILWNKKSTNMDRFCISLECAFEQPHLHDSLSCWNEYIPHNLCIRLCWEIVWVC